MTDDAADQFAGILATLASEKASDAAEAAAVLFQAGVAVLATNFPAEAVLEMMSAIAADSIFGVKDLLGAGETRQ